MRFEEQAQTYLEKLAKRKRNPVTAGTLAVYRSHLTNWILPELGKLPLSKVDNAAMRDFVAKLSEAELSPAFIASVQGTIKEVISSAIDKQGNELFPIKWNSEFIDSPQIDRKKQKTPIISQEGLQEALGRTQNTIGYVGPLFRIAAATGLRISEIGALQARPEPNSSYFDPTRRILAVNSALYRGKEQATKTDAGVREVDLCPALVNYIVSHCPTTGRLIPASRQSAYNAAETYRIPGFHSLRRFRATHLEKNNVPEGLRRFWLGHADGSVSDRYIKIGQDIASRKEWCEKVGVGFEL